MNSMYRKLILVCATVVVVGLLLLAALSVSGPSPDRDTIYQTSTIDALLLGVYDGTTQFGELHENGDFGLGTLQALDGEMVALDGEFYQVRVDGTVHTVAEAMATPFAVVTWFDPDIVQSIEEPVNLSVLEGEIQRAFPSENLFYAIRIDGTFSHLKARSVPAQEKPYPPLVEAVKNQSVFEFSDIKGSIVGFWSPAFVDGINVPGYHLHFIAADRDSGGHVLDFMLSEGTVMIDPSNAFTLVLPEESDFHTADLGGDHGDDLQTVEN
jgi:acetolactate decarboxylase